MENWKPYTHHIHIVQCFTLYATASSLSRTTTTTAHIYADAHRNHYHNIKIRASVKGRPNQTEPCQAMHECNELQYSWAPHLGKNLLLPRGELWYGNFCVRESGSHFASSGSGECILSIVLWKYNGGNRLKWPQYFMKRCVDTVDASAH